MGENTAIEWADHTYNIWTGCEPVSPACAGCYAEAWAKRAGRDFNERRLTTQSNRNLPYRWQEDHDWRQQHGRSPLAFVNSLSDFFDNKVPQSWRAPFYQIAKATPDVIYLIVTKRIGNAKSMLPEDWGEGYPNIWIGSTIVDPNELRRDILKLLRTPARKHFLSIEPMLEEMNLREIPIADPNAGCTNLTFDALTGFWTGNAAGLAESKAKRALPEVMPPLDWVITGGESGSTARPASIKWFRSLRDQCAQTHTPFFFKQWGEWISSFEASAPAWAQSRQVPPMHPFPRSLEVAVRLGKKKTGSKLDGVEHKAWPTLDRK